MKQFDLNIERVLEDWGVHHALREIIANALDEQALTKSDDVTITKDKEGRWHMRDYDRGLRYDHLTQNENQEKLSRPDVVIGKLGVGLKDALATFDRHAVRVLIQSRYGDITLSTIPKHGFDDIRTLHAVIHDPSNPRMVGTDVIIERIVESNPRRLAQSVEHHLHTVGVAGSSPLAPTTTQPLTPLRSAGSGGFLGGFSEPVGARQELLHPSSSGNC